MKHGGMELDLVYILTGYMSLRPYMVNTATEKEGKNQGSQ